MTRLLPASAIDTPSGPAAVNGHHRGDLQLHDLVAVVGGLEHLLATQPVIEQSKGILMGHLGIGPGAAFDVLRRWSSHINLKVRDICEILVTTATTNPPANPGRASQELIILAPASTMARSRRRKDLLADAAWRGSVAKQPGGVDVRFDAAGGGMSTECGMGAVGIVAVVDHDPNGTVHRRPLIQTDESGSRGGWRNVGIEHDQPIPITATRTVLPDIVTVAVSVLSLAICAVVGGPRRYTGCNNRCVKGVPEVGGQVDECAGHCRVEDDAALSVESRT